MALVSDDLIVLDFYYYDIMLVIYSPRFGAITRLREVGCPRNGQGCQPETILRVSNFLRSIMLTRLSMARPG